MKFGEKGKVGVAYTGDLPYQFRGPVSDCLYVWRDATPRWVDKRDLPSLVKEAGRDKLESGPDTDKQKTGKLGTGAYGEEPEEPESTESIESTEEAQ